MLIALLACSGSDPGIHVDSPLQAVEETERFRLPLSAPAWVVYTASGVPHVYAETDRDLAVAFGFTLARDRFFQVDLARRLALGTLSGLLGDVSLPADQESRAIGMTHATDLVLSTAPPRLQETFEGYAEGINAYIDAVNAGSLAPPSEYDLAAPLLGFDSPGAAMARFEARDVAAIGGAVLYRLGFETDDVNRTADVLALDTLFDGSANAPLRESAAKTLYATLHPVETVSSAPDWVPGRRGAPMGKGVPVLGPQVNPALLSRLRTRLDAWQNRVGRDHQEGWGSNSWAVSGSFTHDGRALLAGDGHLELDIPALMYQVGLDTELLGHGDVHAVGLSIVGIPMLAVGTNGAVAWSTTQLSGDVTDWYAEQLQLDAEGRPSATLFDGAWQPMVAVDEVYEIADVPALGSTGRTETWTRWVLFDGRWLSEVEGRVLAEGDLPGAGETVIDLAGAKVVPGDIDGDGVITGVSFDFGGLDPGNLLAMFDEFARAGDIDAFAQATRMAQALSQNVIAADADGRILYTGYQMTPCRDNLRDIDGSWLPGGDPQQLLDGTNFGGFTLPVDASLAAVESDTDPARCILAWDRIPHAFDPPQGFVLTANNDPGALSFDDDLTKNDVYMGGPWDDGFRARTIETGLQAAIADGDATVDEMATLQADHHSPTAILLANALLESLDYARSLDDTSTGADARVFAVWNDHVAQFEEVQNRLVTWVDSGAFARSGVETFYDPVLPGDAEAAVATMIWNTWLGDVTALAIDDEGLPGAVFRLGGTATRLRLLHEMLSQRGDTLAADADPMTGESVFWDNRATADVESSHEIILLALEASLDFLVSEPIDAGEGGFGTDDMSAWTWGLRHQVEFQSLVLSYLDDPLLGALLTPFAIDTSDLPLAPDVVAGDPRYGLSWFPRHGDNRNVDAANPGLSGRSFRYGSGPVMRMVFSIGRDGVTGQNIIPGGQSGLLDTATSSDQTALWLANDTLSVQLAVEDVVAASTGKTTLIPLTDP